MSTLTLLRCRRCGAPVDAGVRADLRGPLLLDLACGQCGTRALYEAPRGVRAGH